MPSQRIGFVDDDLDNFHANTYLDALRGPLAGRGEVAGVTALRQTSGVEWANRHGVPYFDTVADLAKHVDAFAILAPSTPATHLELCEQVLPHGKPTFVDKTFAPDASTAEQIFALADRFAAPLQSTSALRTTNVQAEVARLPQPPRSMWVSAGGASFGEYGVHPVELVVSCLGSDVRRMTVAGVEPRMTLVLEFEDGRVATIDFHAEQHVPFFAVLGAESGALSVAVDDNPLFVDAMSALLDFFEAGRPLVPRCETMAIMRILEAAKQPRVRETWVELGPRS